MFSEQQLQKIEELRKAYPTSKALTLPVLWMVQEQEGTISEEAMQYVANLLGVSPGHILGVVTFYTMFHPKQVGRHHLEVCTNVSCMLRGSQKILSRLEERLGTKCGSTSTDGRFTISEVECMGSCGTAPMLAIGEEYFENLTDQKIDELVDSLK
jgi:NADH-quinone oxidoreductase E subunit